MKHIEKQRQRSGVRRHFEAGQDLEDVQGCYRRVETLCRELQVGLIEWYCRLSSNPALERSASQNVEEPGGTASSKWFI